MIDIDAKLNTFLSQNFETEVLEFKEARNGYNFDSLGEYFSALSNEANLKGRVVMLDMDLAECGATVAKFATVQNQGN